MKIDYRFAFLFLLAILAGLILAWVDSRPGWDDTGLTTGMAVIVTALFGYLHPERPWIWGLAIGLWTPLFSFVSHGDYKMILVTLFSFAGAYLGSSVRNNKPADPD